jgi:hypothetical protein
MGATPYFILELNQYVRSKVGYENYSYQGVYRYLN